MTENGQTVTTGFPPSDRIAAQVAELRELEKLYPEPSLDEVMADWEWLYAECNRGTLFDIYGQFVAVRDKQIVGTGDGHNELRLRMARKYGCHPERFVITFLGDYRDYL
jgi:hypothetical protein